MYRIIPLIKATLYRCQKYSVPLDKCAAMFDILIDTFTSSTECSAEPDRNLSLMFSLQLAEESHYSQLHFRRSPLLVRIYQHCPNRLFCQTTLTPAGRCFFQL